MMTAFNVAWCLRPMVRVLTHVDGISIDISNRSVRVDETRSKCGSTRTMGRRHHAL